MSQNGDRASRRAWAGGERAAGSPVGAFGAVALALMLAACGALPASSRGAASGPSAQAAPTTATPTTATQRTATHATTGLATTGPSGAAGGAAAGSPGANRGGTASPASAPPTTVHPAPHLQVGNSGPAVLGLQQRLTSLGYWLGPPDGVFSDATQQAVFAYQKAAGLTPDGVVGPRTTAALAAGVVPHARSTSGYAIEIDLADDLMLFVDNGQVQHILNTSTGGGYVYSSDGVTAVADTPVGVFSIIRQVNGMVTDSLGQLWRPKFFYSGFAIHGDGYVPPFPVSHGCARVSDEAINWIWADNLAPIGTKVWVY